MTPAALSVTLLLLGAASALHVGGRPAVPPPLRAAALRPASLLMDADAEEEPQLDRSAPIPTGTGGAAPSSKPAPAAAAPGLSPCSIKVIGVGGGGGNTINRMVQEGPGVERSTFLEYVACNTDIQARGPSSRGRPAPATPSTRVRRRPSRRSPPRSPTGRSSSAGTRRRVGWERAGRGQGEGRGVRKEGEERREREGGGEEGGGDQAD